MNIEEVIRKEIDYQISSKSNIWNALMLTIGSTISLTFVKTFPFD